MRVNHHESAARLAVFAAGHGNPLGIVREGGKMQKRVSRMQLASAKGSKVEPAGGEEEGRLFTSAFSFSSVLSESFTPHLLSGW